MPNLDVPRYYTVYELIKILTTFPPNTEILVAEVGAVNINDMKMKMSCTPLRAEGQDWCVLTKGDE